MRDDDPKAVARYLIAYHGTQAAWKVACERAERFARCDSREAANHWSRIADAVAELSHYERGSAPTVAVTR